MSTKFALPRIDNYYSDYHQLTFYYDKKQKAYAMYTQLVDEYGGVHAQYMAINLAHVITYEPITIWINFFTDWFMKRWIHEFLHLIGLSELGIRRVNELGFP